MSPELETLDQLLGGDLPVSVILKRFPDIQRFIRALDAMLKAGEVRLSASDGMEVPKWQWSEALAIPSDGMHVAITEVGARRIG